MRSTERIGLATACVCIAAALGTAACGKRVVLGMVVGNPEDAASVAPNTSGTGAFNMLDSATVPAFTSEEDAAVGDAAGEADDSTADDGESDDHHGESGDSSDEHAEESEMEERSEDDDGSDIEEGSETEETRDTAEAERLSD